MRHHALNGALVLSFGTRGVIADQITNAKFFVTRFRGFGVLTPSPKLCRSCRGVSTAVPHCDIGCVRGRTTTQCI